MKQNKQKRGNIMQFFLNILILIVIFGGFIFSLWYTAFRLHAHFSFIHFWPLQIVIAIVAISSFAALITTSRFSNPFASLVNVLGGYVILFIVFSFLLLGIQLIGLEYLKADEDTFDMHPSTKTDTIKSVLEELTLRNDMPSVLMHHSPVGVQYADAAEINLMLSGHTHAGQIFPFSLIARLTFPFSSGLYQQGNTKLFVSNGAGAYMVRMRLGSRNEINLLRLKGE